MYTYVVIVECSQERNQIKDIYLCQVCSIRNESYTTHIIEIHYAFKLLIQELISINILPRIKVETDIYNEQPSMHT